MVDLQQATFTSRQKVKLLIIPLLAVILVIVIFGQRQTDQVSEPETATAIAPATELRSAHDTTVIADVGPTRNMLRQQRPQISLESMLARNPFAFPTMLAPAEAVVETTLIDPMPSEFDIELEQRQHLLEQWRSMEMTAYYHSGRQPVAMVGTRVLREGDILDGGVRVVEIHSNEVTYEAYSPGDHNP